MKVRKLAVALALAGGLGSGVAQALGLGEIELQSYLNEPLDAEINLRKSQGISPADVFVNIAPRSAYDRVGIDRSFFLTKLDFQVTTAPDGSLTVNVSSREPLREPYLNFLIEVTWPNGRLMREYAVLVDPPVYAEESGVDEQVSAPATTQASQTETRQQTRQPAQTQSTGTASQARSSGARTLGPTNSSDTLWTIAAQTRPNTNVSMQQVMLAIQDLNPDAFINGNINRLKRGEILRIPDENQIRSRTRAEATREVAVQNEAFSSPQRTVDATGEAADGPSAETSGSTGGDQLRLMAADDSEAAESSDSGSAGGDSDTADGVDAGAAVAMEELESARRENDELTGRVDDLQDQVETLQRLLELKNTQLAEMQGAQTDPGGDGEPVSDDPAPEMAESDDASASESEASASESEEGPAEGLDAASEDPSAQGMEEDASPEADPDMAADSQEQAGEMGAAETADEQIDAAGDEPTAPSEDPSMEAEAPSAEPAEPEESAPAQKPFPGNIIDAISNNFIYQVALGGGLVLLLLLLLLLARRNANREKAFYDELNSDTGADETDSFDLTFDEDEDGSVPEGDAIAEADAYIAYGRNDQAAHTLETAISREPSRTDLRLKLLGVYADIQDRQSFDKQFREIEALDDEAAMVEAQSLQDRLEEAESMPSIDDLESQLRSGGSEPEEATSYDSNYDIDSYDDTAAPDSELSDSVLTGSDESERETDFEDMDLDLPDADDDTDGKTGDDRDDLIEYDLSDIEAKDEASDLDEDDTADLSGEESEEKDGAFDYTLDDDDLEDGDQDDSDLDDDDLSLDLEESDLDVDDESAPDTESGDREGVAEKDASDADDDLEVDEGGELDESFLDELDAELDKVAGEDDSPEDGGESELDDLELDVSDEDLALMEEFSESDDASPADAPESAEADELSLDDELGLEDSLKSEKPEGPASEEEDSNVVPPVASDTSSASDSGRDLDEADLGDDDDFDFLSGTDEAATKLDLARAYVEMGDVDGARDILEEVALEGNEEQKAEAQDLLKNLS